MVVFSSAQIVEEFDLVSSISQPWSRHWLHPASRSLLTYYSRLGNGNWIVPISIFEDKYI
jgi:hypothetical protein